MTAHVDVSIVVPVHNEAGNIAPLLAEMAERFAGLSHEIIVVDDGSVDGGVDAEIRSHPGPIRLLIHERRSGKSRALLSGFRVARGRWIATIDGDGQNDPADLARLFDEHGAGPCDRLIAGVRDARNDGIAKMATSRLANAVRRRVLRDDSHDSGCGLKIMPRWFAVELPYFDSMHRFLPALARRAGLRVVEARVADRPRRHGVSKYGFFDRAGVAFLDLVGAYWLIRRFSDPGTVSERCLLDGGRTAAGPAEAQPQRVASAKLIANASLRTLR